MENLFDLTDDDGEVRELTTEEFSRGVPFRDLPEAEKFCFQSPVLVRPDGEQPYWLAAQKSAVSEDAAAKSWQTVGLAPEIVAAFQDRGGDWQGEMESALRDWLRDHAA